MADLGSHLLYAAVWLSFGLGHSVLANEAPKAWLANWLGAGYRLVFNGYAVVHLAVVLAAGTLLMGAEPAFDRPWPLVIAQGVLVISGAVVMAAGLSKYDLGRFGGWSQWRAARAGRPIAEDEPLRLDGLHRFLRHPIYAGAHLFLWGRAIDALGLATALWASLYLVIGMVLEERRLVRRYGTAYQDYQAQVPALIPWPGRTYR